MAVSEASRSRTADGAAAAELALTDRRWLDVVASHADALVYHRPAWSEVLADWYGYRPFVLATLDDDGAVTGGVPIVEIRRRRGRPRWVGLPFSDTCPPLLVSTTPEPFAQALEQSRSDADIRSLEVRGDAPVAGALRRSDAVTHTIELDDDPDRLYAGLHPSHIKRSVRRAVRDGLVARQGETLADTVDVYYSLHLDTRRRLGIPVQPRGFFECLWRHLLEPGLGRLVLVYAGDRPVAGGVFLNGHSTVTYKYGASDPAFWSARPNHLLLWTAMRSACLAGYRTFDFGRSDLVDTGLRSFKSSWGAAEHPLVYSTFSPAESSHAVNAARLVLRRSPRWLCRAAGELFYRYAA